MRTLAAHFFLDTQNWRGTITGSSCSRSKPARTPPAPYSALTQQNLCYFVAFTWFKIKRSTCDPSEPLRSQQNTGFVSFGLLPPPLCAGKSILHYGSRSVNWILLNLAPTRCSTAAPCFTFQLLISKRINQSYRFTPMIQSPLNSLDFAIFCQ